MKFEERQQEGESFDSFLIAIKELAADAELCPSCLDDRVTTRIMSGIRDKETRRKLLALRPFPTLLHAVDICRSEEASRASNEMLQDINQGHHGVFQIARQRQRSPSRGHPRRTCPASVPDLANLDGKRHPMDIVFPLFPSNFTLNFPLIAENVIIYNN